jgi:glycosyltransferase involved in cell wall biosynthesis
VLLTKNEEKNLASCLDSVYGWADEIVVVDDESTDKTVEIARHYNTRLFIRKMDIEGIHRNWAYAQAKNNWVLSLDADERVTSELRNEISELLRQRQIKYAGFTIPRRNYIGSYWVRSGGWYPSPQLKLFCKDRFRYEEVEVHPRAFLDGNCGHLKNDILHYSYRSFADFLDKLNHQSTLEATKWIKQGKPMWLIHFTWRAVDRFFRTYIRKKSYRDGFVGFMIAFFASLYQIMSYAKYWEYRRCTQMNRYG